MNKSGKYEIDMCNGPLVGKLIRFTIPLIFTSVLQLLFNAADIVVVGRFAGKEAMAAVGSTGALINLIINVLMGLSIGTSVLVARYYGANDPERVSKAVHTSITISVVGGLLIGVLGIVICRPMLELMGTPEDVIDGAELYMRIYFAGFPVIALYNFGASVLRAVGDTKRPLYFLFIAGVVNVLLNLLCVIVLKMGVAGVAVPTVVSQLISSILVTVCLIKSESSIRLHLKKLKIDGATMREMLKIGLPAGIQGSVFSISNVIIQSSINIFGSVAVAGNSAAGNLEGFVYVIMNSFYQAALNFTGQNMGAGKLDRVKKTLYACVGMVTIAGVLSGVGVWLLGTPLSSIYSTDPEVIAYSTLRLAYVCAPYFICGIMDTMVGMMRGMGYSIAPMLVSMIGVCGFRLGWIYTVFARHKTLETLYISYPFSWTITALVHIACFIWAYRKVKRTMPLQQQA